MPFATHARHVSIPDPSSAFLLTSPAVAAAARRAMGQALATPQPSPPAGALVASPEHRAVEDVVSDADLCRMILEVMAPQDVARVEAVSKACAAAVLRDGYWRRELQRRFPSALPEAQPATSVAGAAAAAAQAREVFRRRASAELRRIPFELREPAPLSAVEQLCENYRWCLELRDAPSEESGDTLFSASFHVGARRGWAAVRGMAGCRETYPLVVHALNGLDVPRLKALADAGEDNGLCASLVVERHPVLLYGNDTIETASLLQDACVSVCVHEDDGYAVLGVQTPHCEDELHPRDWIDERTDTQFVRRLYEAGEDDEEESDGDNVDDPEKWMAIKQFLFVLLPLALPPDRHAKVDTPQVWVNYIETVSGYDITDEDMLTYVQSLEYE